MDANEIESMKRAIAQHCAALPLHCLPQKSTAENARGARVPPWWSGRSCARCLVGPTLTDNRLKALRLWSWCLPSPFGKGDLIKGDLIRS